jgi:hypothetical protein
MPSEAPDLTVATPKRNPPAPYWAFFATEDFACWNFVDRSRDDAKTPPPQQSEQSHQRFAQRRGSSCTDTPTL